MIFLERVLLELNLQLDGFQGGRVEDITSNSFENAPLLLLSGYWALEECAQDRVHACLVPGGIGGTRVTKLLGYERDAMW